MWSTLFHQDKQRKGFARILLILVIAVFVIGVIIILGKDTVHSVVTIGSPAVSPILPQNSTEIKNWQIYKNGIYTVQYPNNWYAKQDPDYPNSVTINENGVQNSNVITINITVASDRILPSTWAYNPDSGSSVNKTIRTIDIHSYKGIRGNQIDTEKQLVSDLVFLQNPQGGMVQLILTPSKTDSNTSEQIFDQLLSTFTFHQ